MAGISNPIKDNRSLSISKAAKKDEFYTLLPTVENELRHYRRHFKDSIVLCNCDDPFESNFFKFFALNFNYLGLKKLIATCYVDSPIASGQMSLFDTETEEEITKKPHKIVITEVDDANGDGAFDIADVEWLIKNNANVLTQLEGNGDFRSEECKKLMQESDIVVTNPPFSLFREYVGQLMDMDKKFLIIGNQNAVTYKEIFPLLKDNKIWLGYHSGHTLFAVPETYEIPDHLGTDRARVRGAGYKVDENGKLWRDLGNICWFTNLDHSKRHEQLDLFKAYDLKKYPKYGNYDAIEVGRVADIPCDYAGVMGVPVTFLDKFNPDQFEIVGRDGDLDLSITYPFFTPPKDSATLQKYKSHNRTWRVQNAYVIGDDGYPRTIYKRLFIRNLHPEAPLD